MGKKYNTKGMTFKQRQKLEETARQQRDASLARVHPAPPVKEVEDYVQEIKHAHNELRFRATQQPIKLGNVPNKLIVNRWDYTRVTDVTPPPAPAPDEHAQIHHVDVSGFRYTQSKGITFGMGGYGIEPAPPTLDNAIGRRFFHSPEVDLVEQPGYDQKRVLPQEVPEEEANLIGSLTEDNLHAPVLDIDFPAQLIPSTTPGHYHLYLDKKIQWWQYQRLLRELALAGILEEGYAKGAYKQGYSAVRPPGITKPSGGTLPAMRSEDTINRQELLKARMEVQALQERVDELHSEIVRRDQIRGWL